jgi:hypothetical protein
MAAKKQTRSKKGHPARSDRGCEGGAAPAATTGRPPPALDEARHAAEQRAAYGAELLEKRVFAAFMAAALSLDEFIETPAYRTYLEQVVEETGCTDPVMKMLVLQTCFCHFRVAKLHIAASEAKGLEGTKILNAAAARLLGEMRRTALAPRAYRGGVPKDKGKCQERARLFKAAQ